MIVHINHLQRGQATAAGGLVATLLGLLEEGRADPRLLPHLRVHLDWIQYRRNFREAMTVRRAMDTRGEPLPLAEVAVDLRQIRAETLREDLARALSAASGEADETSGRVHLEGFVPLRQSLIWRFNRLFWQHLAAWEEVSGRGGRAARLERAARMVAILRGLGYAGAYFGGTHDAGQIAWIIQRGEALAPRWEEFAAELTYAPRGGFYLYEGGGRGVRPRRDLGPFILDALGGLFPVQRETWLGRLLRGLFGWVDWHPLIAKGLERAEMGIKGPAFGCQACGNCVLGHMEYVCPQTCPKQMRNGPCGGAHLGRCEVVDKPCIWGAVYERATAADRLADLRVYIPPPDRHLQGTSSWINYFLDRDSRPVTAAGGDRARTLVREKKGD